MNLIDADKFFLSSINPTIVKGITEIICKFPFKIEKNNVTKEKETPPALGFEYL